MHVRRCRSYKGSHLALVVEMLAGPLVGAAFADKLGARNWGNLVLAIDPAAVSGDGDAFRRNAAALLARVQGRDAAAGLRWASAARSKERCTGRCAARLIRTPADQCRARSQDLNAAQRKFRAESTAYSNHRAHTT